ncbi:MAG TPA: MoaD/ThiS family protein [Allosphingosinicella sp.]|uniref:MoaD/ThiS family protein n=1 Tax=Allosphingosinicella sp. TaxID=2823234 RepID=UPI002ED9C204
MALGFLDILYFGSFREAFGRDCERVDPPSHVLTVADLIEWLAVQGEPYASVFGDRSRVRAAVEGVSAAPGDSVFGAREVALFPPGGVL